MREQLAYNSNADKVYIAQWSVESALQVSTIGDPLSKKPGTFRKYWIWVRDDFIRIGRFSAKLRLLHQVGNYRGLDCIILKTATKHYNSIIFCFLQSSKSSDYTLADEKNDKEESWIVIHFVAIQ